MQPLREYQARAMVQVRQAWANGARRVLLVSPTGSGKTRMGEEAASTGRVLWLAHRKELIADASSRMRESFGALDVGIIASGASPSPYARVQVSSVQTLVERNVWPEVDRVIFDEAHHYVADKWNALSRHYETQQHLLLTATPERRDGKSMSGVADVMLVAASYSELIASGHLCDARAYQPGSVLEPGKLAMDPVKAWLKFSDGQPGFAFFSSIDSCYEHEHRLNEAGVKAAVIEQSTDKAERARIIEALRDGSLDCICNVQTMTEGIDVPRASVCMLASACDHCGPYLQKGGRVLRPHPSKKFARIIDLVGAWVLHGLPTEDRIYSLDGEPIKRAATGTLRNCLKCGAICEPQNRSCPMCGEVFVAQNSKRQDVEILGIELQEVYAGIHTPEQAKQSEYKRLREIQRTSGQTIEWVRKEYRKLFSETCVIRDGSRDEHNAYLKKFKAVARKQGHNPKAAGVMFKGVFGFWPAGL